MSERIDAYTKAERHAGRIKFRDRQSGCIRSGLLSNFAHFVWHED